MALSPNQTTCSIVGIGASAGGLDALRRLLGALPADPPFAVVVVQHLDPSTRSQLAEIIGRACEMRVVRAKGGETAVVGTVYVVPEGREARLENGVLRLRKRSKTCSEPIDAFFTSLAGHNGANGCGVVLSGNGSDGALGLREIRGAGGITFAQDPSTAEYPAMPSAAIESGVCDFIGSPEQIAEDLVSHVHHHAFGGASVDKRTTKAAVEREAKALARILGLVRIDSGMDFSGYKPTTINRRVGRRAMLKDAQSLDAYLATLEDQPEELSALVDDLLINVTQFFRDTEVFEGLRSRVFPEMLKGKSDGDTIRIWVVGCSTGEEVYSVLITALEASEAAHARPKITVFGTDASELAVKRARAGIYPPSVCASISPERLARYFVRTEQGFEIDRSLRDMCVFARQDVTKDTPFSRLDLVSLRNVLIYMDQPLQRQVLAVAHFGLVPDGFLLLGTSETPETEPRLFRAFDKQNHVYRRQDVASRLPVDVANSARAAIDTLSTLTPPFALDADTLDPHAAANEMALLVYAPPRVVVDVNDHILHFFGDTSPYLEHAAGRATLDVNEMARPGIALELKEALEVAKTIDGRAAREATFVSAGDKTRVSIEVTPLPAPPGTTQLMVAFRDLSSAEMAPASSVTSEDLSRLYESREQRVRGELGALRGRLRSIAEEKEQFNQSLRSANEEIRSSNEELQSINEELETAKEELQSANEELITVNDELRQSNRDMVLVNDDLTNFMGSIDVPVIMLDRSLRVRRFTPQAERVVRIESSDVGRLLEHLRLRVDVADLPRIAAEVIESETSQQFEVRDDDDCWYTMSARPYRSAEGVVDGVVIAFVDVDELKRNAEQLERRARLSESLAAIDADLASTMEFDEIMQRALDEGAKAVGSDAGTIEIREQDSWVVRYQHGFGAEEVGMRLSQADAPNATAAARLGTPLMIADMTADKRVNVGFVKAHGLKSVLAVPLTVRGAVVGCLLFYRRQAAHGFTDDQVEFGRRLGTAASLALENARLMEAERESTRRAETLNAINEIIRSTVTPDELLGRLVGEVSLIAGADKSLLIKIDGDGLEVTHVRNLSTDLIGRRGPADFFPGFALAARERHALLVEDAWADPRTNKDFVIPYELRAFRLLPLIVGESVAGVLALAYDQPQAFDADDADFTERVASAMSIALTNALLYAAEVEAQKRALWESERIRVLQEITTTATSSLSLSEIGERVASTLSARLGASSASIYAVDGELSELRALSIVGYPKKVERQIQVMPINEESSVGHLVLHRLTELTHDSGYIPPTSQERLRRMHADTRRWVALSISAGHALLGVYAMVFDGNRPFEEDELSLYRSIAELLGAAFENARLFEAEQVELARTTILREVATAAASTVDAHELSERVLAACRERLGAKAGSIYVIDREERVLATTALFGFPEAILHQMQRMELDEARASARSYLKNEVVRHDSPDLPPGIARRAKAAEALKDRWLSVPVRARGEIVGSFGLIFPGQRAFSPEELGLYQAIADQLGVGLDNAQLFEAEVDARRQADQELDTTGALLEAARAISGWVDLPGVAQALAKVVMKSTSHSRIVVDFWDEGHREIVVLASEGDGPYEIGSRWPIDKMSIAGQRAVFEKQGGVWDFDALSTDERGVAIPVYGSHLGLYVPLVSRGAVVGLLILDDPGTRRDFSDREIRLVEGIASHAAVAIENAGLFEAEQARAERMALLREAAATASSSLSVREVAAHITASLLDLLGARQAQIRMLSADGHGLDSVAVAGTPAGYLERLGSIPVESDIETARVFRSGQTATGEDVLALAVSEESRRHAEEAGVRSYILAPLRSANEPIGILYAAWEEPRGFSANEVAFVEALSGQFATGLKNAMLFDAERRSHARVEALHALTELATSSLDLAESVDAALTYVHANLGVDVVTFWMLDQTRQRLLPTASVGFPREFHDRFALGVGLDEPFVIAEAVSAGKPIAYGGGHIADVPEPVRASYAQFDVALEALLVLPVRGLAGVIGAVTFAWSSPHTLNADEVRYFASIANELAIGTENATLFAEVRESARLDEALNVIDANIHSTLDFDEIMNRSLSDGVEALGCDAGAVEMREGAGWLVRYQSGFEVDPTGRVLSDAEAVCAMTTMSTRAPFVVQDATCDAGVNVGMIAEQGLRSALAVPLVVRDTVTGSLLFYMRDRVRTFRDVEIDFAVKLAASVSLATENAELFESEQRELARTRILQAVATAASSSLSLTEVCELALREVRSLPDAAAAGIYVLDEERNVLLNVGTFGYPAKVRKAVAELAIDDTSNPGRVALHGLDLLTHEDSGNPPEAVARLAAMGVPSARWASLPIRSAGRLIGVIGFIFHGERSFEPQEIALFSGIADTLAASLANARLYESELEARREAKAELETTGLLLETANTLASWADVETALERLGDILLDSTDHGRVTLNLWDEERQELRTVVSKGKAAMSPATFPASVLSPQVKAVIAKKKTTVFDYDALPEGETATLAAERAIHLGLIIPIVYQDRVLGLVAVDSPGERRAFEAREIKRLEGVAAQAGIAIENARLYESARTELFRATVLKEVAAIGAETLDVKRLGELALKTLKRLLGATSGTMYVLDESAQVLRNVASLGIPQKAIAAYKEVPLDSDTTTVRVVRAAAPVMHDSEDVDEAAQRVTKVTGIPDSRWVQLPVKVEDKVIGTLALSFSEQRAFLPAELRLYSSVADIIGVSLEKATLVEQLDESRRGVTQILESISDGFYALDREWRFTYANAEAARMIGAPHEDLVGKTIGEVVGDSDVLRFQQESFGPAMNDGQVVELERYFPQTGIWADVRVFPAADGVSVYGHDITESRVIEEALRQARNRADMMAMLLDESSQPFGVGNLDGTMGLVNHAFENLTGYSAEELQMLSWASTLTPPEYAQMEAEMLDRLVSTGEPVRYEKEYLRKDGTRVPIELLVHLARDENGDPLHYYAFATDLTERMARERLDVAFNVARTAIGGTLDYAEIMSAALAVGAEALGVDSAVAFRREPRGWRAVHSLGMPKSMGTGPFPDAEALGAPVVADEQRPVAINEPGVEARLNQSLIKRYGIKSVLAAPLGVKGAEIGAVAFYHRKRPEVFNDVQIEFITRLARVVTLAIQNSMLYERERKIADTLQDALLTPPETIDGIETSYLYQAASDTANVGGDFYDVFLLDDHSCAIVVGDVSGKGIDAARLTSLMHDGIRAYAMETNDPVELLDRLNHLVCALTPPERFATVFLGVLDTRHGRLRYVTAGHPAPAVVGDKGATYLISTRSPVMGAFSQAQFACLETVLRLGERLVLFTDGVTEARRGMQFLGEEGLLRLLGTMTKTPVGKFSQRLLDKVLKFSDGHLRDDTVILSLERTKDTDGKE